jgi:hypothetical protein
MKREELRKKIEKETGQPAEFMSFYYFESLENSYLDFINNTGAKTPLDHLCEKVRSVIKSAFDPREIYDIAITPDQSVFYCAVILKDTGKLKIMKGSIFNGEPDRILILDF